MVAHVGDYGLTRFLGTNSNKNSSTGVKGTIAYAPPEYGLGREMNSSGDVYSFGILLLEVRRRTDNIFNESIELHKYASIALPDPVSDVIDGYLIPKSEQEDTSAMKSKATNAQKIEECLTSTVKIGVSCSLDSPPQRMKIENAVHELQHILDALQSVRLLGIEAIVPDRSTRSGCYIQKKT